MHYTLSLLSLPISCPSAASIIHERVQLLEFLIVLELHLHLHAQLLLFRLERLLAVLEVQVAREPRRDHPEQALAPQELHSSVQRLKLLRVEGMPADELGELGAHHALQIVGFDRSLDGDVLIFAQGVKLEDFVEGGLGEAIDDDLLVLLEAEGHDAVDVSAGLRELGGDGDFGALDEDCEGVRGVHQL